jgi:hypothetical protein
MTMPPQRCPPPPSGIVVIGFTQGFLPGPTIDPNVIKHTQTSAWMAAATQHTTACCSALVVGIELMELWPTYITYNKVVQQTSRVQNSQTFMVTRVQRSCSVQWGLMTNFKIYIFLALKSMAQLSLVPLEGSNLCSKILCCSFHVTYSSIYRF